MLPRSELCSLPKTAMIRKHRKGGCKSKTPLPNWRPSKNADSGRSNVGPGVPEITGSFDSLGLGYIYQARNGTYNPNVRPKHESFHGVVLVYPFRLLGLVRVENHAEAYAAESLVDSAEYEAK